MDDVGCSGAVGRSNHVVPGAHQARRLMQNALAMSVVCVLSGFADPPPDKKGPPKRVPEETAKAWKKDGAEVGWMGVDKFGSLQFLPEEEGVVGDLPAFRFDSWKEGLLAKVPAPAPEVGLDLHNTPVTDAGLKELAAFKNLQALDLTGTEVTDGGLKDLAALKSLRVLDLAVTSVTDAGLR